MQSLGRGLFILGIALAIAGAALWLLPGKFRWLGRLPGDIRIGDSFYFPLATCLLVSVVLTILLNLALRLLR